MKTKGYKPSDFLIQLLAEAEREWKAGKAIGPFTLEEMLQELEA